MGAQFGAAALPLGMPSLGPFLRGEYHLSLAWLGALLAVPTAGLAAASFVWGRLSDRVGERRVIVLGMTVAAALLAAASAFPADSAAFVALVFGAGAAGAAAPAASGRAVIGWFPVNERGLALSLRHTAPMAGGAAAAAVLPAIAQAGGLRAACLALAAFELGGAVFAAWLIAPPGPAVAAVHHRAGPPLTRDRLLMTLVVAGGLVIVAQGVLTRFLPDYLHSERGWSPALAGGALSVTLACAAVMRIVAGVVADRHGRRIVTLRTQAAGAGVLLVLASLMAWLPSPAAAAALVLATGLTMAGNGVAWAAVSEAVPHRAGAALGLYSGLLVAVITVAPPIFGLAVGSHSLGYAFGVVGLFPLAGAAVFVVAERRRVATATPQPAG